MIESTARHALPLLAAGQAQKEVFHNEALARADLLLAPAVMAGPGDVPPSAPEPGQCWLVGAAPTGDWAGQAGALAGWTDGGWRFVAPREGMRAWAGGDAPEWRYVAGAWQPDVLAGSALRIGGVQVVGARRPAIPGPTGGSASDPEARAAIASILAALRAHGLIAG